MLRFCYTSGDPQPSLPQALPHSTTEMAPAETKEWACYCCAPRCGLILFGWYMKTWVNTPDRSRPAMPRPPAAKAVTDGQKGGTSGSCSLPDEQEDSLDFEKIGGTSKQ